MERDPLNHSLPEADAQKPERKRNRRRKSKSPVRVPLGVEAPVADAQETKKPKPNMLDAALADFALHKRAEKEKAKPVETPTKAAEKPAETEEPWQPRADEGAIDFAEAAPVEKPKEESAVETEPTDTAKEESAETIAEPEDTEKSLPIYELKPNEFSGGEVIIPLDGPIKNHVVELPLHLPAAEQAPEPVERPEPIMYKEQPQQQQQQRYEQAVQPSAPAPQAEAVLTPPSDPLEQTTRAVETTPEDPTEAFQRYQTQQEQVPSGGEAVATKQDVEDAVHYAAKDGQRRGVVAGAVLAGGYEHFKHRRREKKQAKQMDEQSKKMTKAEEQHKWLVQEQAKQQAANMRERTFAERAHEAVATPFEQMEHFQKTSASNEQYPRAVGMPEKQVAAPQAAAEKGAPEKRFAPQDPAGSERLTVPSDHHLETSAWHTIEVDKKTGKAVENPSFEYGHEYYRERAQEAGPKDQRNGAAGGAALAATAMNSTDQAASAQQSQSAAQPSYTSQSTAYIPDATKKVTKSAYTGARSDAPLWPWFLVLAVIIVCIIALL